MTQDRAYAPTIHVTQEMLSLVLGVRRVGITNAASSLQRRGLMRYSRGHITVVNGRELRAAACVCYRADRTSYDRLLGTAPGRLGRPRAREAGGTYVRQRTYGIPIVA